MWIRSRVSKIIVDTVHQLVGDSVLEAVRLLMHLIPAIAEDLHQESLQQSMAPNHGDRIATTGLSQLDLAVRPVGDQTGIDQTAQRT